METFLRVISCVTFCEVNEQVRSQQYNLYERYYETSDFPPKAHPRLEDNSLSSTNLA